MARIPIYIVDAFATNPFAGNPAVIVPDATALSPATMRQITDELQMEAGFILPPTTPEADLRLRFFTRRHEAMVSGHVIVAAFTVMVEQGRFEPTPEGLPLLHETGLGVLPVLLSSTTDGECEVTFDLPLPRFGEPVPALQVATALGLPPTFVQYDEHLPQRVSCGFDTLVVPISDANAIRGKFTDMTAIRRLADDLGVGGVACFHADTTSSHRDLYCRFFFPGEGANEEVVSGTALGAVTAYCLHKGIVRRGSNVRLVSEQGHALGRPNRALIEARLDGERIVRLCLTGTGVVVLRGEIEVQEQAAAVSA
ncbi:MAG: PhzF family phenazine biosynthesis protein [bacterium]